MGREASHTTAAHCSPKSPRNPHSDLLPSPYPLSHSLRFPSSSKSHWQRACEPFLGFGQVPYPTLPLVVVEGVAEWAL